MDWAEKIRYLVDEVAPEAEKIVLVMDNLNTHKIASLYKAFLSEEARQIAKKLEVHYTPKHDSWLDIAELGINIMTRECLNRRIPSIDALRKELAAWNTATTWTHRRLTGSSHHQNHESSFNVCILKQKSFTRNVLKAWRKDSKQHN